MSRKQRFMVIAWPKDHNEGDMAGHACDLQDFIDMICMGGAKVIAPISSQLHDACDEHVKHLRDVF